LRAGVVRRQSVPTLGILRPGVGGTVIDANLTTISAVDPPGTAARNGDRDGARCAACGSSGLESWRAATVADPRLRDGRRYRLDRCSVCGTATLAPPPDTKLRLYDVGTYRPGRGRLEPVIELVRVVTDRDRLRFLNSVRSGGRVFEIGAGDGRLLALLAARGYAVSGVEPSEAYAALARSAGVAVETTTAEEAEVDPGSQDAVIAWHVLEHLADPAATVARIRGWLGPSGRLIAAVPNLSSIQARLGGDRWFHQDVPRHRTHFTVEGIERLLSRTGYDVVRLRTTLLDQNLAGMHLTLLNLLTRERNVLFHLAKRNLGPRRGAGQARDVLTTVVAAPLLLPVAAAVEFVAGATGRGGSLVVEAVPREERSAA
jgi:SAM-dependent methyltransferase